MNHDYTSTYCQHNDCGTCATVRKTCKTCNATCNHGCHTGEPIDPPSPVHLYLSTYCMHDRHDECKNACAVCRSRCTCYCHFQIITEPVRPSITCPRCGRTSWHPMDIKMGYCGFCHDWTSRQETT